MVDLRDDSAVEQNEEEKEIFSLDEYKIVKFRTPTARTETDGKPTIEEVLTDHEGVLGVEVDYAAKITTVKYETDMTNPDSLSEVLRDGGYENQILEEDESDISNPDIFDGVDNLDTPDKE